MKRFRNVLGGVLGLVGLGVLTVVLTLVFSSLMDKQTPEVSLSPLESPTPSERGVTLPSPTITAMDETFKSPLPTLTKIPTLPPSPTPLPTSTRPPEPPTRAPTPTYTPAPPTPTPEPLPTLIPGLQTFVYTTIGNMGPEIYRVQVDEKERVVETLYRVDTADLWHGRTLIKGLYPSPDGNRVAVAWVFGDAGHFVSLLDVNDGRFTRLFDKVANIDRRAFFLDWSPKGDSILIRGGMGNPDLGRKMWLVDTDARTYQVVDIGLEHESPTVWGASFSPSGSEIVYSLSGSSTTPSEVWRISLSSAEKTLLFTHPTDKIEEVKWSPKGDLITFVTRPFTPQDIELGELWVIDTNGKNPRRLASALTAHKVESYYEGFAPVWSPNGSHIAFVSGEIKAKDEVKNWYDGWHSAIYVVDAQSGQMRQLSSLEDAQVLSPTWSPDGSYVAFAANSSDFRERFAPWVVFTDAQEVAPLRSTTDIVMDSPHSSPIVRWLPISLGGHRE